MGDEEQASGKSQEDELSQALHRFLRPTDDVKTYLDAAVLPRLTPALQRLLHVAVEQKCIPDLKVAKLPGEEEEDAKRKRSSKNADKRKNSTPGAAEPDFNALLWLSDHLRQFTTPAGYSKYRERFDARRAAMREIINAGIGKSHLDLLDQPPSFDEQIKVEKSEEEAQVLQDLFQEMPGPMMGSLGLGALEKVRDATSILEVEEQGVIAEQGQPIAHVNIVIDGEVESEVRTGQNATDDDELTQLLLRRVYTRGQWWPVECLFDQDPPHLSTTRAVGKVRVAQIPVQFFRQLLLPASIQARSLSFRLIYYAPGLSHVCRYARALLALECMQACSNEDSKELHADTQPICVLVDGAVVDAHGDKHEAPCVCGQIFSTDGKLGPIVADPADRKSVV